MSGIKLKVRLSQHGALLALAVLFVISAVASPVFLQSQNLINILRQVSFEGNIAIGMTFVIIAGGIDLSVGSMMAFVAGLMILLMNHLGGTVPAILAAMAFGIGFGALLGLANGLMITKGRIAPFIVTLGTMAIFRSLCLYFGDGGEYRSMTEDYAVLGTGGLGPLPYPVIIFFGLAIVAHIVLTKTAFGRYVFAVGSNEKVARYSAINVGRVKTWTYIIVGAATSLTAITMSSRLNSVSSSNGGSGFELNAIAAVIIGGASLNGGRGTIAGSVIGAVILGIVNNMLNMMNVSAYLQGAVKGLIIIIAVLIQRQDSKE